MKTATRAQVNRVLRAAGVSFEMTEPVPFERGRRRLVSAGVHTFHDSQGVTVCHTVQGWPDSVSVLRQCAAVLGQAGFVVAFDLAVVTVAVSREMVTGDVLALWGITADQVRTGLGGFVASVPVAVRVIG